MDNPGRKTFDMLCNVARRTLTDWREDDIVYSNGDIRARFMSGYKNETLEIFYDSDISSESQPKPGED